MKKFTMLFSLFFVLFLVGCSEQSIETITDPDTKSKVEVVTNIESKMILYKNMYDNMDRGNHDFFDQDIVVDTQHYDENQIKRGEIVYYKTPTVNNPNLSPSEKSISRVIALSGEKIKVEKGQIYINGKMLDTFYGKYHNRGANIDDYKKMLKEGNSSDHVNGYISQIENTNMQEIAIPQGHVFIIGDTWDRSIDSREFGPLPQEKIIGKVIGYK
ncbi:signal peptidase I [Ammoniphilus sp. 3BR4]|uniref:signal peptidase I n=1 Tax=Ammoniphilus sp. 3BR4 TaxID=3158265 RepID=UPI0034671655